MDIFFEWVGGALYSMLQESPKNGLVAVVDNPSCEDILAEWAMGSLLCFQKEEGMSKRRQELLPLLHLVLRECQEVSNIFKPQETSCDFRWHHIQSVAFRLFFSFCDLSLYISLGFTCVF